MRTGIDVDLTEDRILLLEDKWRSVVDEEYGKAQNRTDENIIASLNGFVAEDAVIKYWHTRKALVNGRDPGYDFIYKGIRYNIKTKTVDHIRDTDIFVKYFTIPLNHCYAADRFMLCCYSREDKKVRIWSVITRQDLKRRGTFVMEGNPLPYNPNIKTDKSCYIVKASSGSYFF